MLNFIDRPVATPARTRRFRLAAPLACAWMLAASAAQAAETMSMPMDASASTPFSQYQNWRDEPLQDWSAANGRVGEIGGWQTYLRESQQGEGGTDPGSQSHQGQHGQ